MQLQHYMVLSAVMRALVADLDRCYLGLDADETRWPFGAPHGTLLLC